MIDNKGAIQQFNAAAEQMFGYTEQDVMGKNVSVLMPSPYREQHDQYITAYQDSKKPNIIGIGREVQAARSNGSVFPIYLSVGEIKHVEPVQFVGIIRDISEQRQAQRDIEESRERLSHVSRLSSMGELAAGIAHEINQPLTAVSTYAHACKLMLENQQSQDVEVLHEKLVNTLDKIRTQAQRASDVIQRLRSFVKKRVAQRESFRLNQLISDTINMAKVDTRLLDHAINLMLEHSPSPYLYADPVQIQQVLLNLIRNAIDAMEDQPGAPMTIKSEWLDDNNISVSVIDSGPGIDEQTATTLFDPFFTTKASGMGMGLPISQGIIHAHGGQLHYAPGNELGSIFTFVLPASKEPNEQEDFINE